MENTLFEISIPITTEEYINKLPKLRDLSDKYKAVFLGHDDIHGLVDFGWENRLNNNDLHNFSKDLYEIIE